MTKSLQKEVRTLRKRNERLRKRVAKLELALRYEALAWSADEIRAKARESLEFWEKCDIKEVAGALLRGVDRLAQAQQIVVSSLENARATSSRSHTVTTPFDMV